MKRHSVEVIPTDLHQFEDASAVELGYDPDLLDRKYFEWRSDENGPRVGVYVTQPRVEGEAGKEKDRRPEATVIMPASHNYRLEQLWMRRADIIATRMGVRVVCVEMPGTVGLLKAHPDNSWSVYDDTAPLPGAKNTPQQYWGASRGDFSHHASVQLDAIQGSIELDESDRIILLGESMGAPVVVDMLKEAHERGLDVTDVVLLEMVNAFKGRDFSILRGLAGALSGTEKVRRDDDYLKTNKVNGHPMVAFEMGSDEPDNPAKVAKQKKLDDARKSLHQQGFATIVNGLGMARGRQEDLAKAKRYYGEKAPKFTLVRGRESLVTSPSDYEALVEALGEKVTTHEVTDRHNKRPIGHFALYSLGIQAAVADALRDPLSIAT